MTVLRLVAPEPEAQEANHLRLDAKEVNSDRRRQGRGGVETKASHRRRPKVRRADLARLDLELPVGKFPELLSRQRRLLSEGQGIPVLISKNQGRSLFTEMEALAKIGGSAMWISTLYKDMEWKLPSSSCMEILRLEVPR